jgi:hypothetical protein
VVAAAPLSEFETYEALQRMVEAGWVEPVGRREPGRAPPPLELPNTARPDQPRWARDLSVAALLIAVVVVLRLTSQFIAKETVRPVSTDVFAAAQVRDLRMALDLYRREHGVYPAALQELVAERWVTRERLQIAGHELRYLRPPDQQAYQLELSNGR